MIYIRQSHEGEEIFEHAIGVGYTWDNDRRPFFDWLWASIPWFTRKWFWNAYLDVKRTGWHRLVLCWRVENDHGHRFFILRDWDPIQPRSSLLSRR